MSASKIAAVLLVGSLLLIAFSVNSIFHSTEHENEYLNKVDKYFDLLTSPNSKMTDLEGHQLSSNASQISEWIRLDKQHFTLQLPNNFFPHYQDVYLSIFEDSPITCGQVAFSSPAQEWIQFVASRRSNVALMAGDGQLTDKEFDQLYRRVCIKL